jgi:hypothetical protein
LLITLREERLNQLGQFTAELLAGWAQPIQMLPNVGEISVCPALTLTSSLTK